MTDIITALYHAASSEEPDTMDGPSLCDYYQRREETEQTRRALVDAVGDEVDVDSYGVAMECQGFVNGFRLALGLCMARVHCGAERHPASNWNTPHRAASARESPSRFYGHFSP